MKRLSPFAVNLTVNLEPVYGIGLAVLIYLMHTKGWLHAPQFNQERMSTGFYIGTLLIVISVLIHPLVARLMKEKEPGPTPPIPI